MVVLKKIKASTLMETLVATVLIVVVFMMSSLIMNNLFTNTIKNNTRSINNHLNELEYLFINNELKVPYLESYKNWEITIKESGNNTHLILLEAINEKTNKTIIKQISDH